MVAECECDVCCEILDLHRRRPKALPCGHTTCLQCLERLQDGRCPQCRCELPEASAIPDNFYVIQIIQQQMVEREDERRGLGPNKRWWCVDCMTAARGGCEETHTVRRLKAALRRQIQEVMPRASTNIESMEQMQSTEEEQVLAALDLINDADATCHVCVRKRCGKLFKARVRMGRPEYDIVKVVVAFLVARGDLEEGSCWDEQCHCQDDGPAFGGQDSASEDEARSSPSVEAPGPLDEEAAEEGCEPREPRLEQEPAGKPAAAPATPAASAAPAPRPSLPWSLAEPQTVVPQINVEYLSREPSIKRQNEKMAMLELLRQRGVRALTSVRCDMDPTWTLQLLQSAAPMVQDLEIVNPRAEHLTAAHTMPRLQRLFIMGGEALYSHPPELPALPEGQRSHLRRLTVDGTRGLPMKTLSSVLHAHGSSLQELQLRVGTPGYNEWPWCCNKLQTLLGAGRLTAMRRILLLRSHGPYFNYYQHDRAACVTQMATARRVLPLASVLCEFCDDIQMETISDPQR